MFLKHIHYFRAFAIINIVFTHVWGIPQIYKESQNSTYTFIHIAREVFFHDSTIYFILISGFLFYYLSPKFELMQYYRSKLYYVIFPYVFITSLIIIATVNEYTDPASTFFLSLKKILGIFVYGKGQFKYWYIPFISLVFIISPVLLKIPKKIFLKIVVITSFLPLLGTRTGTHISIWQYIYFFPVYLQGIYIAMDYSNFISLINMKKRILIFIAITTSILLAFFFHGENCYIGLLNITESIYYIQKLSISFLIIIFFEKLEHKNIPILNRFAEYSFAIYFTHLLVGDSFFKEYYYHFLTESSLLIFPASLVYVIVVIFASLLICMSIKKILGKRSRYFIGA